MNPIDKGRVQTKVMHNLQQKSPTKRSNALEISILIAILPPLTVLDNILTTSKAIHI